MKKIGIYRKAFLKTSESFIKEQALPLQKYEPIFIGCTRLKEIPFSSFYVDENKKIDINKYSYLLTRSPKYLPIEKLRDLSLIHAHFGPDGAYAMAIAAELSIPFCVTFHGYDITIDRSRIIQTRRPLYYQLIWHEKKLQEKASAFIAVSDFIRQQLLEKGYPASKIIQHYIGVDTEKFSPIQEKPKERYIFCVGRHTEKKGIDVLLRAFSRIASKYPDVLLIQVGTGRLTPKLQALAHSLGISNQARFLGEQPHEKVLRLMQGAEIFVLPSHRAKDGDCEALGIVFNEASACGIPIISTWHGGIPEAVLDGETGFLVPEKDDAALAEKLDILLGDRTLGQNMGQSGREFVCEFFDIKKQTAQLETIYDSIVHGAL